MRRFFKGFCLTLLTIIIILVFCWFLLWITEATVAVWGVVFGWFVPGIIFLIICIICGIVYMSHDDINI